MRIDWQKQDAGWVARIGDITLYASPDRTARFGTKAARGTKWRAGVSSWDEPTRTISRYGRDVYMQFCDSANDAMRLAEQVYNEQLATREAA
jgi:hypothetical protein